MKASKIFVAAAVMSIATAGSALAFHEGGVAYCDGCHTMHNSSKGVKMTVNGTTGSFVSNQYLLKGVDQSSTCLSCHSKTGSYAVATNPVPAAGVAPKNYTPGGDFSWVQKDYSWTNPRTGSSPKDRHGHNIIAADYGYTADATLTVAPGGSYPNTKLACSSCHDPHGKYRTLQDGSIVVPTIGSAVLPTAASGSYGAQATADEAVGVYRLLAGAGYEPKSAPGFPFTANSPVAIAPNSYNVAETTAPNRVAYGSGMSEWCANCHTNIHNDSLTSNLRHPASNAAKLTAEIANNYTAYVKSGDLSNTNAATAYETLVPVEVGLTGSNADKATLITYVAGGAKATQGGDTTSNVMCLSCHRAHATGFQAMTRWNNNNEFLTVAGVYADASKTYDVNDETTYPNIADGKTTAEYQAAMNGKPATAFAHAQRSLCNKCHAKD